MHQATHIAQDIEVTRGQDEELLQVTGGEEEAYQVIGDERKELLEVKEEDDKLPHAMGVQVKGLSSQREESSHISGGQCEQLSEVAVDEGEEFSHGEQPLPAADVPDVAQESEVHTGLPSQAGTESMLRLYLCCYAIKLCIIQCLA